MIIGCDFDGTLCEDLFPQVGRPNMKLINWLLKQKSYGHKLILWTCREGAYLEQAIMWCLSFGLSFDAHNTNVWETIEQYDPNGTGARKVVCDLYIDDKNCIPSKIVDYENAKEYSKDGFDSER